MAGTWRLGTASMVLATGWTMAGRGAEAQLEPLPLPVAIYVYAALPPPVLERAKDVATTIYGRIGVSVTWLAGPQVAMAAATNTGLLQFRPALMQGRHKSHAPGSSAVVHSAG
jgi:hypothetical protein